MKSSFRIALVSLGLALALSGPAATTAHAQSALTRDQVRAELAEALRTGSILANGESGLTLRELYPQRYPATAGPGISRAQVLKELQEARRTGDLLAAGDSGLLLNQLYPQRYANVAPVTSSPVQATSGDHAMSQ
jgi:hypothetical protein